MLKNGLQETESAYILPDDIKALMLNISELHLFVFCLTEFYKNGPNRPAVIKRPFQALT